MSGRIPRRTFLKGVGTMMAVPLLESMLPLTALAGTMKARPTRMAFISVPNGINMSCWTPAEEGAALTLPSTLEPLAGVRGSLNILTGLTQHNAFDLGDGPGDHARSASVWLTGVHPKKTSGADIHCGISVDQIAAQRFGKDTRFPSLELGCEKGGMAGDCDSGYSCAYSSSISWRGESTPVAKEVNPRSVFDRLFGDGDLTGQDENAFKRRAYKMSILDFVQEDAASLTAKLGKHDQKKLEEYMAAVREIEQRLGKFETNMALLKQAGERPHGIPESYDEHIRLMGDMMILAFQTDLTRVSTFMLANEGSNRSYRQIGVPEGHHDVSHHGNDPAKLDKKRMIDRYHVQQLAYMLNKMQSIKELDGTLLDHSLVVYGGGISDGNRHNHDDLPTLLAGGTALRIKGGRHIRYNNGTPLTNLFVTMLDRAGVPVETLGDSTGKLQQLF